MTCQIEALKDELQKLDITILHLMEQQEEENETRHVPQLELLTYQKQQRDKLCDGSLTEKKPFQTELKKIDMKMLYLLDQQKMTKETLKGCMQQVDMLTMQLKLKDEYCKEILYQNKSLKDELQKLDFKVLYLVQQQQEKLKLLTRKIKINCECWGQINLQNKSLKDELHQLSLKMLHLEKKQMQQQQHQLNQQLQQQQQQQGEEEEEEEERSNQQQMQQQHEPNQQYQHHVDQQHEPNQQYQHHVDQQYQHHVDQQHELNEQYYQYQPSQQYQHHIDQQHQLDQQYQHHVDQQHELNEQQYQHHVDQQHQPDQQYQHLVDQQHELNEQQYLYQPGQQYQHHVDQQHQPNQQYQHQIHQQYQHHVEQQHKLDEQQFQHHVDQQHQLNQQQPLPNEDVKSNLVSPTSSTTSSVYQSFQGQFSSILNKMSPDNFQELITQITLLVFHTEEQLNSAVTMVFDKAVSEPEYSAVYAKLCCYLRKVTVPVANVPGKSVNFRRVLIKQCQREFENGINRETKYQSEPKIWSLFTELQEKRDKAHQRLLGSIRFIGELFKVNIMVEAIILECLIKLFKDHTEQSIECICCLIGVVGKQLDSCNQAMMDHYFKMLERIVHNRMTSNHIRKLLLDIIDCRMRKWIPSCIE